MTTTAIGHAITAVVMLAICPIALTWMGSSKESEDQREISEHSVKPKEESPVQHAGIEKPDDEDIVEIVN